jgi:hypothetical protein
LATNDEPAALLKKIQETEQQLKENKVIVEEYTAKKLELQGLMYPTANKWSDVIPTINRLRDITAAINAHTPEVYKQQEKLLFEEWRKEFHKSGTHFQRYYI